MFIGVFTYESSQLVRLDQTRQYQTDPKHYNIKNDPKHKYQTDPKHYNFRRTLNTKISDEP